MDVFEDAAALFRLLSLPSRLAILQILRDGEQCVCHMEAALGLRQAYISQQLMVLRQAGLVMDRREGWNVFYRVVKPEVYVLLDAALIAARAEGSALPQMCHRRPAACPCPKCHHESVR